MMMLIATKLHVRRVLHGPHWEPAYTAAALERCAWPMPLSVWRGVTHQSLSPNGYAHGLMDSWHVMFLWHGAV